MDKGLISLSPESGTLPDDCRFLIVPNSAGNFRLTSRFISAFFALTAGRTSSSTVEAYTYTGALDQQWFLEKYTLTMSAVESPMMVGEQQQIKLNVATDSVTWKSSNSMVAGVSNTGIVTGRFPGTTTITATAVNGMTVSCTITVEKAVYSKEGSAAVLFSFGFDSPSGVTAIAYNVHISARVTIDMAAGANARRVSEVHAFTYIERSGLNPYLSVPDLTIGRTSINEQDIDIQYDDSPQWVGDWIWDSRVGIPNVQVGNLATLTTRSCCFQDDAFVPYKEVILTLDF